MANGKASVRVDVIIGEEAALRTARVKNTKNGQVILGAKLEVLQNGELDQFVFHVPDSRAKRQELVEALNHMARIIDNAPDAEDVGGEDE